MSFFDNLDENDELADKRFMRSKEQVPEELLGDKVVLGGKAKEVPLMGAEGEDAHGVGGQLTSFFKNFGTNIASKFGYNPAAGAPVPADAVKPVAAPGGSFPKLGGMIGKPSEDGGAPSKMPAIVNAAPIYQSGGRSLLSEQELEELRKNKGMV